MAVLASLKYRAFAFLWTGQTVSRLGDRIYDIALAWWVLEKTHSAIAMGGVLIAAFLPTLVFLLVGGVVADCLPRLGIMLASDLARGVLVAGMALLAFLGYLPLWPIFGISFCFGLLDVFFLPAYSAVVPQLLPATDLPSGNALRVLSDHAMAIAGPAIGAGLIAVGGTPVAFFINAASFFVSALCLLGAIPPVRRISPMPPMVTAIPNPRGILAQFLRDFREGMATTRSLTWIWLTIAIAAPANVISGGATDVALPFYVQQTLQSPLIYGGLTTASAVGTILAALWYGSRKHRHRGWMIYGFFIGNLLPLSLIGWHPTPPIILGGMLVFGLCATILGLAWMHALQEYVPNEQMGRVTSIDQLGSYIGIPLSYGLAGVLTDRVGPMPMLLWGGVPVSRRAASSRCCSVAGNPRCSSAIAAPQSRIVVIAIAIVRSKDGASNRAPLDRSHCFETPPPQHSWKGAKS
jgi:MFS family permease